MPAGYSAASRRAVNISFNGTAYSEAKLLAFGYAYEQATKLRKPASEIVPSLYRCAKTTPPSVFAARGACAPGAELLGADRRRAEPAVRGRDRVGAQPRGAHDRRRR